MIKEEDAQMPTRNINLTDRYDAFLTAQIDSGRFKNASEAVRAALHLLEQRDREEEAKLEALRRDVQVGTEAIERGDTAVLDSQDDMDAFFAKLTAERHAKLADKV